MYEIWKHNPTSTQVICQSHDPQKLVPLSVALQQQYNVRCHCGRHDKRLRTPDFPKFTVRDNAGYCIYSAWYSECQRYKEVPTNNALD